MHTVARTLTAIEAASAPAFLAGEIASRFAAIAPIRYLYPTVQNVANEVLLSHWRAWAGLMR